LHTPATPFPPRSAGEEWAANTPFFYFTDYPEPELARAVREGRCREFAAFGWKPEDTTDPQAAETFDRSKLNWSELSNPVHTQLLDWHKQLIQLRHLEPSLSDGRLNCVHVTCDENERWLVLERKRRQPITGSRPQTGPRTPEDKTRARTERARKYEAMNRGESWALNPKDRGAARGLARDFIDSKRRVSEYYMYIVVLLLIGVFAGGKAAQSFISPAILVLAVILLIESQLVKAALRRLLNERMPGEPMKGLVLYAMLRALQIRRLRMPAPRVKPGDDF
jgi:hypothetical protein